MHFIAVPTGGRWNGFPTLGQESSPASRSTLCQHSYRSIRKS